MPVTRASLNKIQKETDELLTLMNLKIESSVSADLDGVRIDLKGKDGALLIGYHGDNLSAFAYVLGLILHKNIDKELTFRVDVNSYLKEKDRKISDIVLKAIERVRSSNFPEEITGFNSYERRLAHTIVAKEGLDSESKGTLDNRILVIKPRKFNEESS